jgi:hypothetical protein
LPSPEHSTRHAAGGLSGACCAGAALAAIAAKNTATAAIAAARWLADVRRQLTRMGLFLRADALKHADQVRATLINPSKRL